MRPILKLVAGLGILAASFFAALWLIEYFSPACPSGKTTALQHPFQKFAAPGFAYTGAAPEFDAIADSNEAPTRSNLLLCENNNLLGPMHTVHAEITKNGRGRFSHWTGAGFVFSASDNTDPNVNGRNYWIVQPR